MTAGENSKAILKAALHLVQKKKKGGGGVALLTQAQLSSGLYAWAWPIM